MVGLPAALVVQLVGAPVIGPPQLDHPSLPCGECLEVRLPVTARFANPFDPQQVQVTGEFSGPAGQARRVPGFYYQPARRSLDAAGRESVELVDAPDWRLRFAAPEPGRWQLRVRVRDETGETVSPTVTFEATPGAGHGVIRRAAGTRYFEYADGTPFFPLGHNMAWAHQGGLADFERWLAPLPAAGVNLARIWLQWDRTLSIEYHGPRSGSGRYDLANAWRVDQVLATCRRLGLRVFFTLDSPEPYQREHYWLGKLTSRPWTDFCAHNVANGGPLREPREFYTTAAGRELIRQRLRYIVARWGWDDNLFCWELWNELNCFPEWDKLLPEIVAWHRDMAAYLRSLDVQRHLISTSFGNAEGDAAVWRLPELDFVQSHVYGSLDLAGDQAPVTRLMADRYDRPHLFGEFGTRFDWLGELAQRDPQGVHVHNLLWSAIHSGSAGAPLSWCWEYLHDSKVYERYAQLARYVAKVQWPTESFVPLVPQLASTAAARPTAPRDLVLPCGQGAPVGDRVVLDLADPPSALGRFYLYGQAQAAQQRPRVVAVDLPVASRMILRIGRVWVGGELEVRLDGRLVLQHSLPAGPPGQGPYARSEWSAEWRIWGADYDLDLSLDLPAGRHEVALFNAGADGITIDRLTIPACLTAPLQLARGYGLRGRTVALVWLQNRAHCLRNVGEQQPIPAVAGLEVTLPGIPAGPCRLEWWDPWSLEPPRLQSDVATAAGLSAALPRLERDVALQVRW